MRKKERTEGEEGRRKGSQKGQFLLFFIHFLSGQNHKEYPTDAACGTHQSCARLLCESGALTEPKQELVRISISATDMKS